MLSVASLNVQHMQKILDRKNIDLKTKITVAFNESPSCVFSCGIKTVCRKHAYNCVWNKMLKKSIWRRRVATGLYLLRLHMMLQSGCKTNRMDCNRIIKYYRIYIKWILFVIKRFFVLLRKQHYGHIKSRLQSTNF